MLDAPTMEYDRINFRRSGPVQKRQQIFETVPARHRGHLFRVGEIPVMQLHRSRPEPRRSTFERCWLGNATGRWRSGQAGLRDLFSLRSPEPALPPVRDRKPNCAPRSMNGINARQRLDSVAIARAGASFSQLRVCRWYIHSRTPYPSANPRFNPHTMSKNDGAYSNRKPVAAVLLSAFLIHLREGCRYSTSLGGHSRPSWGT